jgi:hypothetical protein
MNKYKPREIWKIERQVNVEMKKVVFFCDKTVQLYIMREKTWQPKIISTKQNISHWEKGAV